MILDTCMTESVSIYASSISAKWKRSIKYGAEELYYLNWQQLGRKSVKLCFFSPFKAWSRSKVVVSLSLVLCERAIIEKWQCTKVLKMAILQCHFSMMAHWQNTNDRETAASDKDDTVQSVNLVLFEQCLVRILNPITFFGQAENEEIDLFLFNVSGASFFVEDMKLFEGWGC